MKEVNIYTLLVLLVIIPAAIAHIGDFDEVWKARAKEAEKESEKAYDPHPEDVTNSVNKDVRQTVDEIDPPKRNLLGKDEGPCVSTGPSGSCWRCKGNWANNRLKLPNCFGKW